MVVWTTFYCTWCLIFYKQYLEDSSVNVVCNFEDCRLRKEQQLDQPIPLALDHFWAGWCKDWSRRYVSVCDLWRNNSSSRNGEELKDSVFIILSVFCLQMVLEVILRSWSIVYILMKYVGSLNKPCLSKQQCCLRTGLPHLAIVDYQHDNYHRIVNDSIIVLVDSKLPKTSLFPKMTKDIFSQ